MAAGYGKRPQPYRLQFPLNAQQVEYIDQMFEILFRQQFQTQQRIDQVDTAASTTATTALPVSILPTQDGYENAFPALALDSVPRFTPGSVIFAGSAGQLAQDNAKFFWDNTNFRLGIGTAAPGYDLHISGNTNAFAATAFRIENINTGASAYTLFDFVAGSNNMRAFVPSQGVADQTAYLGTFGAGLDFSLMSNNIGRWTVKANGNLFATSDNAYAIGDSAGNRPSVIYACGLELVASSPNGLTNKNIYLTGTINQSTPVGVYMDTTFTGLTGAASAASGFYLTPSFNLTGNYNGVSTFTLPIPTVTLNGFTVTDATTLDIQGPPTNGTNRRAMWVRAGYVQVDGILAFGGLTSSFSALRDFGSGIMGCRLADDSAFGYFSAFRYLNTSLDFNLGSDGSASPYMSLRGTSGNSSGVNLANTTTTASDVLGHIDFGSTGTAGSEKRGWTLQAILIGSAAASITSDLLFYGTSAGTIGERFRLLAAGGFQMSTRGIITAPADAQWTFANAASSSGFGVQCGTADTMIVANQAQSAYGTVDALVYKSENATFLMKSGVAWTNNAAAAVGTLNNAPAAGNPTKWIAIDDNGTTRYIPAW